MCIDSSRKTQLVPDGQAVEQAPRAEEVDVGEGAVEEQPLDARGEADQVEQERAAGRSLRLEPVELEDRVDPPEAELGLGRIDGMFSTAANASCRSLLVGQVGVEQGQVELDVHGLLEQLPRQVEPGLGGVDVLVEVEHEVVGDDRVAGREERHEPADRCCSAGGSRWQVPRSEWRSTSSTVQVFLIASR